MNRKTKRLRKIPRRSRRTRRTRTRTRRSRFGRSIKKHDQKMYYMKGCSKKYKRGGFGPIGGLTIHGGNSNAFVGSPYDIDKGGNYYKLQDNFSVDRDYKLRGGTLIPSNLLNLGRQISYNAETVYNGLGGYEEPTNPSPYVQKNI
jgi:hypothetical protein